MKRKDWIIIQISPRTCIWSATTEYSISIDPWQFGLGGSAVSGLNLRHLLTVATNGVSGVFVTEFKYDFELWKSSVRVDLGLSRSQVFVFLPSSLPRPSRPQNNAFGSNFSSPKVVSKSVSRASFFTFRFTASAKRVGCASVLADGLRLVERLFARFPSNGLSVSFRCRFLRIPRCLFNVNSPSRSLVGEANAHDMGEGSSNSWLAEETELSLWHEPPSSSIAVSSRSAIVSYVWSVFIVEFSSSPPRLPPRTFFLSSTSPKRISATVFPVKFTSCSLNEETELR